MSLNDALGAFDSAFKQRLSDSTKATLIWVTATSVDWERKIMDAVDADGLEYFDVLLGVDSQAVKPKVDADCLIAIVENDSATSVLISADEVEEVQLTIGETKLLVDEEGYKVEQADENLKTVLTNLIEEIQKIVVVVGTTPNVLALEEIKVRLGKILK